ncbi:hypothetical protein ACHAWX_007345 [Stephanocyclus meneghinianus]
MKLLLLLAIPAAATQIDVNQILTRSSSPTPGNVEKSLPPTITNTRMPTALPTFIFGTPAPSLMNEGGVPSFQPSRFSTPFPTEEVDDSVSGVPVTSTPESLPTRKPTGEPTNKPSSKPSNNPTNGPSYKPTHRPINLPPIIAADDYKSDDDKYNSYENINHNGDSKDDGEHSYENQQEQNEWNSDMNVMEADEGSSKSRKGGKSGKGSKGSHKAGKDGSKSAKGGGKSSTSTSKLGKRSIGTHDNEYSWNEEEKSEKGVSKSDNNSIAKSGKNWQGDMDGGYPSWWDGYYRGLRLVGHQQA